MSRMPPMSRRERRDFEEFDEFACERFRLLLPSSSIGQINSLTRRLMVLCYRHFEGYSRSLMRELLLYQRQLSILRSRYYFLMGEALDEEALAAI